MKTRFIKPRLLKIDLIKIGLMIGITLFSINLIGCAVKNVYGEEIARFGTPTENPYEYPPFKGYPIYKGSAFTSVP